MSFAFDKVARIIGDYSLHMGGAAGYEVDYAVGTQVRDGRDSYSTVGDYVRRLRPEIRVEEGRAPAQVSIPQAHQPGAKAEVDFGNVWILLADVRRS